jgi:hypothetical protein
MELVRPDVNKLDINKGKSLLLCCTVIWVVTKGGPLYDASCRPDPSYQQLLAMFALLVATVTL